MKVSVTNTHVLVTCVLAISSFYTATAYRPRTLQRQLKVKVDQLLAQAYLPLFNQPAFDPSKCSPISAMGPSNQFLRCLSSPSVRFMSVQLLTLAARVRDADDLQNLDRSERKQILRLACDFSSKMIACTRGMYPIMQNCMTNVNGNISIQLAEVTNSYFCSKSESGETLNVKFFDMGMDDCITSQRPVIDSCLNATGIRYTPTNDLKEYCSHLAVFKRCVSSGMAECSSQRPREIISEWHSKIERRLKCKEELEGNVEENEDEPEATTEQPVETEEDEFNNHVW